MLETKGDDSIKQGNPIYPRKVGSYLECSWGGTERAVRGVTCKVKCHGDREGAVGRNYISE